MNTTIAIIILFGIFLGLILLRVPITYCLIASSICTTLYIGAPVLTIFQRMAQGVQSFSFLAIPFFILAGEIMGAGGIANRLVAVADIMVGRFRGGLAQVNVVSSTFLGGISGSPSADVSSIGALMIPMMEKQGYDRDFAVNVTVTSATQSMIIPPSHNMVIYALAAGGVSTGKMFLAGVVPGLLLMVALMIITYIITIKRGYPKGRKYGLRESVKIIRDGILGIFTIIIIMLGVSTGLFTATESAAIACLYAFIVTFFVYREIPLSEMWRILGRTIRTLAMILAIIAAANGFCWLMSYLRIPAMVTEALLTVSSNPIVLLILINLLLLFLGCIMDVAPLIVITTPILLPVVLELRMDPIQFGIIMLVNLAIGACTPPVGSVLFAGCAVGKIKIEQAIRGILPFYAAMILVLLLVTYIPAISMTLPNLVMGTA
ncbi:TRAP transporter large permease [Anaerotruncus rubiinfantis]|uniref:TRAP transporter large permease n=1 Tax=Anaerotruncus rubiinfantis TaxID=1720200 RepID=UPI00083008A5|nr:TRAP transporter large permease [Anaerotruncus rubiinfantis]